MTPERSAIASHDESHGHPGPIMVKRTAHPHIVCDSTIYGGEPLVEGTRTAVRHIILLFQGGQDPEVIAANQRLSLAQVYDAISYFYDNEEEIKRYIRNETL